MIRNPLLKRLTGDTLVYGLGRYLQQLIGFFLIPLYTVYLTPSDYGIMDVISVFQATVGIFLVLGLDSAFARFFVDTDNVYEKQHIASTVMYFRSVIVLIFATVIYFTSDALSVFLFKDKAYAGLLVIIAFLLPFRFVYNFSLETLRFSFQPVKYGIITVSVTLINILCAVYLIVMQKQGIWGIYYAMLISIGLIGAPVAFLQIRKQIILFFSTDVLKPLLRFGIPLVPAAVSYWILTYSDRYFLLHFTDLDQIGLYSIGEKFSRILSIVVTGFQLAWGPFVISIYKKEGAKNIFVSVFVIYTFIMSFLAVCISVFAPEIIRLMTQPEYYASYVVIPFIIYTPIANGMYYIVALGTNIMKKTRYIGLTTTIAALLNIGLNFLFIPQYGIVGAALATSLSFALSAILLYFLSQRLYFIPHKWAMVLIIIITSIVVIFVSMQLQNIVDGNIIFYKILLILLFSSLILVVRKEVNRFSLTSVELQNQDK